MKFSKLHDKESEENQPLTKKSKLYTSDSEEANLEDHVVIEVCSPPQPTTDLEEADLEEHKMEADLEDIEAEVDDEEEIEGDWLDIYKRDSDSNGPDDTVKYYADLAIASYNKSEPELYSVVDIIEAAKYLCEGYVVVISFTAKLPNQDAADAITFEAQIWERVADQGDIVEAVAPVNEAVIRDPTLPIWMP